MPPTALRVLASPVGGGSNVSLPLLACSCYRLTVDTSPLVLGTAYDIYVANGLASASMPGSPAVALAARALLAVAPPAPPSSVFTVGVSPGCARVSSCIATAEAAGGGTVTVPAGTYVQTGGESLAFAGSAGAVVVRGAGRGATTIVWPVGTGLPHTPPVTGNGSWALTDLTLAMYAAPQPGAQPPLGLDFVHVGAFAAAVALARVDVIHDQSAYPGIQIGNALSLLGAAYVALVDVSVTHVGNCAAQWPHNQALYVSNSTDVLVRGCAFANGCPGWSVSAAQRVHISDCAFVSLGDVSQGQGVNSLDAPHVTQDFYYGNCSDAGRPAAPERWETMTSDGPGGFFNGSATAASDNPDGTQTLTLATPLACISGVPACLYPGLAVSIMRGTGAGQQRRVVTAAQSPGGPGGGGGGGDSWTRVTVDAPFVPPPDNASFIAVTQFNGRAVFEASTYVNGTVFQTYGMSMQTVAFNNTFVEFFDTALANTTNVAAGVRLFGHRYMGGYETNWRSDVAENTLTCTTLFWAYSDDIDGVEFSHAQALRRNAVAGGVNLSVDFIWDSLIDGNSFASAACAYAGGVTLPAGVINANESSPGTLVLP